MKYMLTAGKFFKKGKFESFSKLDDKSIAEDLKNAITSKRYANMRSTLSVLTNYIISEELRSTGLLHRKNDDFILSKVQHLYWEWKKEKLINDFEDFEDTTKSWIIAYA